MRPTRTYYLAVEVSDFAGIPEEFDRLDIRAALYAVVPAARSQRPSRITRKRSLGSNGTQDGRSPGPRTGSRHPRRFRDA
ncbi:hypothetical protein ACI5FR_01155 [Paenibacillus sp. HJGM_3]